MVHKRNFMGCLMAYSYLVCSAIYIITISELLCFVGKIKMFFMQGNCYDMWDQIHDL